MDSCQYEEVNHDEERACNEKFSWTIFSRQLFISSGVWMVFFIKGICFGATTIFISQIRKEANSTAAISDDMASWIASGCSYGSIPWNFILPILMPVAGRKTIAISVSLSIVILSTIFYFSNTPTQLLIFEILFGFPNSGLLTVLIVVLAEYTSPKYRGMFLMTKSASLYWGIWVSNALGTFFHWKSIAIFALVCSFYTLTVFFWPESPYWLASKGRFEECKAAHRWLKGVNEYTEAELDNLIKSEIELTKSGHKKKVKKAVRDILSTIVSKDFYKPMSVIALCISISILSGKFVCIIYAIDIIKKITNSESAAYTGMLILDGATVVSMYIGCCLARTLKRRTLLFCTSLASIAFLFIISLYLYLVSLSLVMEDKYVSISLLTAFSLSVSCGPLLMATSLYGELMPLRHRSVAMAIISLIFVLLQAIVLKMAPFIFKSLNMHGTFFFYGICMSICGVLLYKYLPETKDKTLQEIEEYFKDIKDNDKRQGKLKDDTGYRTRYCDINRKK